MMPTARPSHQRAFRDSLLFGAFLALAAASLAGCREEPAPFEQQVRDRIAEAEEAAEQSEAGTVVAILTADFVGMGHALGSTATRGIGMAPYPQNRESVAGAVHAVLASYDEVHVLTRIQDLSVAQDTTRGRPVARATVFVAMSAVPIAGPQALSSLEASLYRFDVRFVRDGNEWFVEEATWRRARAEDFL